MLDPTIRKIDKFNSFKDSLSKKEQVTPHYFSDKNHRQGVIILRVKCSLKTGFYRDKSNKKSRLYLSR